MKKLILLLLVLLPTFACGQQLGTCFQGLPNCGPTLARLTITPTNASVINGHTLQMLAEGVESDGTDGGAFGPQCDSLWLSSNTSVATISTSPAFVSGVYQPAGTLTAKAAGTTTISCQLNSFVSGSTLVTVIATPTILAPTCASQPCVLPQGTNGTAYSYTASATPAGGTWSCTAGTCPGSGALSWASLNAGTGAITGTPNTNATTTFTLTYTNTGTASVQVSLTVVAGGCGFPTLCGSTSLSTISYPSTPPNIGGLVGAGTIYTDPTFGSTGLRVTDSLTDPSTAGKSSNTYGASLSGSDDESAWSSDDSMFYVASNGGTIYLFSFVPSTLTLGRPYHANTSGCPTGRSNCSLYGGWSSNTGTFFFSAATSCKLYNQNGTQLSYYLFDCPTFATPPASTSVINYLENLPAGCNNAGGTPCNGLPSDFGSPTWIGNAGTGAGDAIFCANFSSVNYHYGSSTGQNSGFYAVCYVPGKGVTSYNTMTNVILADPGFSGGAGLTCTASQCTGTATSPGSYTIHSGKVNLSGTEDFINVGTVISGTSSPSDSLIWIPGTNIVYLAENNNKASGHGCFGSLGMWNQPGSPLNGWYYRTTPTSGGPSGNPTLQNTVPSPNTIQFDTHCGPQMAGASDTNPVGFQATSNSQSTSGCCELPFDQPPMPWLNELDFITNDGSGRVFREMLTYNSGFSGVDFDAQNTITNFNSGASGHLFGLFGTDWFGTLGNVGGNTTTCVPGGPAWAATKSYPLNYTIKPSHNNAGGYIFKVTVSGTSNGTEPASWPQTVGNTQTDGGVTWTNLGTNTGTGACRTDVILGVMK